MRMYAVITGASGGLGQAFSRQLAARGYNLILSARRTDALEGLRRDLSSRVTVRIFPADLSSQEGRVSLARFCAAQEVGVLINNAGFGLLGPSSGQPPERERELIAVNAEAVQFLTKAIAASMSGGYILNVASLAGFQPAPGFAAYGATKAYILQWSRAVSYEWRREKRPVSLSVLCPGPVSTGFDRAAGAVRSRGGMEPDKCAAIGLRGLFHGKPLIVPGLAMKGAHLASRLLPTRILLPIQYRIQRQKLRPL